MRRFHRLFATAALLGSCVAVSTASAQARAIASYKGLGSFGTPSSLTNFSVGFTFHVEQTTTVTALGALFPILSSGPVSTQEVGLFGGTTFITSAIVGPAASITRTDPSGDPAYVYRYTAVTPFTLLEGNFYTLLSAPMAGSAPTDYTFREFANTFVLDPRFTFEYFTEGDDATPTTNDGVAFATSTNFPDGAPNSYRSVAGPDFLIQSPVTATPEPATVALVATGLLSLGGLARRRRRA